MPDENKNFHFSSKQAITIFYYELLYGIAENIYI